MGFLRRLFGSKKPGHPSSGGSGSKPVKDQRRWSFGKNTTSGKSLPRPPVLHHFDPSASSAPFSDSLEANKHAIAVAAATAAVAEAALAAAHAAAEVVRLTSSGGGVGSASISSIPSTTATQFSASQKLLGDETAAVKIQSAFRGYLARRALKALKALVKLQALVRGHIVRKQTADMLRRMQTLVRLQARARATRAHLSDNMHSFKSSLSHYPVPEDYDHPLRAYSTNFDGSSVLKRCSSNANFRNIESERMRFGSNWLEHWMEESVHNQHGNASLRNGGDPNDVQSDKILEVDTWKPHFISHHSSSSFQTGHHYNLSSEFNNENLLAYESPSKRSTKALNRSVSTSREVPTLSSLKLHKGKEEVAAASRTAYSSPQALSSSSRHGSGARRGPFTPTRSECSWGFFGGYSGHPNYMATTEAYKAKVRSQSAPRQRLEFDRYGSTRSVQGLWDSDFRNKAFPPSNGFNRVGNTNLR